MYMALTQCAFEIFNVVNKCIFQLLEVKTFMVANDVDRVEASELLQGSSGLLTAIVSRT